MYSFDEAKAQIIEILTDASGMTIDHQVIFDLADSNGIDDLIKNSMIKDKLLRSPELLLKNTTLYMYDSSVVDIKVQDDGVAIDWHDSLSSLRPHEACDDASVHYIPEGAIAPPRTKEPENFWPFMVCKAVIRKLYAQDPQPNFRSYYSVLDFLATKHNMCIDRLIKTNPLRIIPFDTLQGILSKYTINYLSGRKLYDDRYY
jgi:hypothetical protein